MENSGTPRVEQSLENSGTAERITQTIHLGMRQVNIVPPPCDGATAQSFEDEQYHTEVLAAMTLHLRGDQVSLCLQILDAAGFGPRCSALGILEQLTPALREIGGVEAITETVRAIEDVGRWWP